MTIPIWLQIIALTVPALVSIFSAILASKSAGRAQRAEHEAQRLRALEDRIAEKKFDLYLPFLSTFGDLLTPSRSQAATAKLEDAIADFQTFVTVWGSDDVVEAFYRFRVGANQDPPHLITMRLMADLMLAIRRDIAWPETEIRGLHMIGIRIKDLQDHPELAQALEMPLRQLCADQSWTPPFEIPEDAK